MGQQGARGATLFNRGLYFEAHEAFEDLWRAAGGAERDLWKGLAQACAGLYKLHAPSGRRDRREVSARLIRRGLGNLRRYAATAAGAAPLRVADLVRDLEQAASRIDGGDPIPSLIIRMRPASRDGSV